jgi:thiamine kinase-like enzyme
MGFGREIIFDEKLPQMGRLMDADCAREIIGRKLFAESDRIEDCRIVRVKYRPGKNCLISYLVRSTDVNARKVAESTITAMICAEGESFPVFYDAQKRSQTGRGVYHAPELETIVWIFPNDRKLTGLPAIADLEYLRKSVLPEVVANIFGDQWTIADLSSDTVHYVAERACTIRVELVLRKAMTGEAQPQILFGKTYCLDEGEFAWRAQQHLWESEERKGCLLLIPEPLAYQPAIKTVWQRGLEGKTLIEFDAQSERFADLLGKAGLSVATLHSLRTPFAPAIAMTDVGQKLETAAQIISQVIPRYEGSLKDLTDHLSASLNEMWSKRVATLHGDLHLKNFFVTGDRVALIDLDNLCQGDPLLDVGSFVASLHYRGLLEGKAFEETERIARHFIRAYQENVDWEISEAGLNWNIAAALIYERAYRCITRMKASRLGIIGDILKLAQKLS